MSSPETPDPHKETIFIHHLSPELEEELVRRAKENGNNPSEEASEIIERHIEENGEE